MQYVSSCLYVCVHMHVFRCLDKSVIIASTSHNSGAGVNSKKFNVDVKFRAATNDYFHCRLICQ